MVLLDHTEVREDMLRNDQVQQFVPNYPYADNFDQARDELLAKSDRRLIRNGDTKALSMYPGSQDVEHGEMSDEELAKCFEGAVELVASHWHRRLKDTQGPNNVLHHILTLATYVEKSDDLDQLIDPSSRQTFLSLLLLAVV